MNERDRTNKERKQRQSEIVWVVVYGATAVFNDTFENKSKTTSVVSAWMAIRLFQTEACKLFDTIPNIQHKRQQQNRARQLWHIRKHQIDIKAVEICQIKSRKSAHFTQSIQTKHHPHLYRRRHSQRHCDGVISFTLLVSLLFFSSKIKYHARDSQFFLLNTFVQIICNSEQRILIFVLVFFEWCRSLAHIIFIYCFEINVIYRHIYNLTEKDFSISMFPLLFHL